MLIDLAELDPRRTIAINPAMIVEVTDNGSGGCMIRLLGGATDMLIGVAADRKAVMAAVNEAALAEALAGAALETSPPDRRTL